MHTLSPATLSPGPADDLGRPVETPTAAIPTTERGLLLAALAHIDRTGETLNAISAEVYRLHEDDPAAERLHGLLRRRFLEETSLPLFIAAEKLGISPHDGTGHVNPAIGHTPGPWTIKIVKTVAEIRSPTADVCDVWMRTPDDLDDPTADYAERRAEMEANATLIARAPEMAAEIARLTATNAKLVEVLAALLSIAPENANDDKTDPEQAEAWALARAALAAATEG